MRKTIKTAKKRQTQCQVDNLKIKMYFCVDDPLDGLAMLLSPLSKKKKNCQSKCQIKYFRIIFVTHLKWQNVVTSVAWTLRQFVRETNGDNCKLLV